MTRETLVQEVSELTEMLRASPRVSTLRLALIERGVDPTTALLGSFYEDEGSHEYGVVVGAGGIVFEYVRDTNASNCGRFTTWELVQDLEKAISEYPQIEVALDMVNH